MAKPRTVFVCSSCGADTPRWSGQCASCGEWNTLAPFTEARDRGGAREGVRRMERPESIARLVTETETRLPTGFAEFDRVLGGGLVPGSVTLIGGEPGIGKSTLLLQCAAALAGDQGVLYATGEESVRQVAERARRLAVDAGSLTLVAETAVERILDHATEAKAAVIVIDSIQTMSVGGLDAAPGAVTQLRESTASLVRHAKSDRDFRAADRPRDPRGRDCGAAGARAHGGHGALLRERFGQPLPRHPRRQEPVWRGQRDRRVRDGGARPARGAQSFRDFPLAQQRTRARIGGHGGARGHAADADRSAGARRREPARESAPRGGRLRGEPGGAAACGPASPCRRRARGARRVRERGRRRTARRDGGRPRRDRGALRRA